MGIFPSAGSNEKMRNYFPAEDCLLKIKVHHCYGEERYIRASVRGCCHIAQLPLGVSRCARTPLSTSPWRLCWSSLSSSVLLWSSKEQLVRFCHRIFFSLPPRGVKPRFCLFVSNRMMAFLKKIKVVSSLMFQWPGPLLSPVPPADAEPQEAKTAPEPGKSDHYCSK